MANQLSSLPERWPWGIGLAAGGMALMVMYLGEGVAAMEGQHWVMLFIVLVVGYVLGRLWTQPAQMLGLP